MRPRMSSRFRAAGAMRALAVLTSCVLGGIAARPDVNGATEPLPEGAAGRQPAANFLSRCQKLLDQQTAVYDGTKALHQVIRDTPDGKPRPEDRQAALRLASREKDLVVDAAKAVDLLEAEKAALAFPEVIRQLRKDMERVEGRLKVGDVGADTQAVEQEIIDTLREMIKALKEH